MFMFVHVPHCLPESKGQCVNEDEEEGARGGRREGGGVNTCYPRNHLEGRRERVGKVALESILGRRGSRGGGVGGRIIMPVVIPLWKAAANGTRK